MTIIDKVRALDEITRNKIIAEATRCHSTFEIIELARTYGKEISEAEAQEALDIMCDIKPVKPARPILGTCMMCDTYTPCNDKKGC